MNEKNGDRPATPPPDDVSRRVFLSRSTRWTLASAAVATHSRARAATPGQHKIKIGQIGVGHGHAKGKMEVLKASDDYQVVGLVEPDPDLQQEAEQGVFRDVPKMTLPQMLNIPGLQAVAVETRVDKLLDVAESCIDAGIHVHLDKPAGQSLARFQRILDQAERRKQIVQMGYMYRYNPAVVMLRSFLNKGWLGEPFEIHAVMSKSIGGEKRRRLAAFEGGMMFELGCHLVDLVVGVLGRPEQVTAFRQHTSPRDDGLWDNMLAVLAYPGALATVKSSANEIEGFARRHFVVCGSEGTCHIQPLDRPSIQVAFSRPRNGYQPEFQQVTVGSYDRYVADFADLARVIRGEKDADYSYAHDLAVQETVLQASKLPPEPVAAAS